MPLVTFARPLALLFLPCVVLALRLGRRRPGRRWRLASALRAAMLTCLMLAAAGPAVRVPATGASVVFAVDRSLSVTASGARDAEAAFVRGALARMRSQDSAGIVTFGGRPALRASVAPQRWPSAVVRSACACAVVFLATCGWASKSAGRRSVPAVRPK